MNREILSDDVVPTRYDLELTPDLVNFIFKGNVVVTCKVNVSTDVISLNAKGLGLSEICFKGCENDKSTKCTKVIQNLLNDVVDLHFEHVLPVGTGKLEIKFLGELNDLMAGFYRSSYVVDGKKRWMATTQFEVMDARRCFPCWDEPSRKAVFGIKMRIPIGKMCVSNMPEKSTVMTEDGFKIVTFEDTPTMSTYLVAFCVGEFESVEAHTRDNVLVRVLCVPGKRSETKYSLQTGVMCLEFYNDFFGVPYPLPKLDMIAIPDFGCGAMENWGLVTYREIDLLCNPETVSIARKQRLTTVVAHEIAHQWFGNLVTMAWWNDLWLNEGFASWMQLHAADHFYPEWKIWDQFVVDTQSRALGLDSLRSSHPIQVEIKNAEQVEEVFDAISYSKGACVVVMLILTVGPGVFNEGIRNYMKKFAYSNAETRDLWQVLEEVSDVKVSSIMSTWTDQMGFPLIILNDDLSIEQQWFLSDGSVMDGDDKPTWKVPLMIGTDSEQKNMLFCDKKGKLDIGASAKWIKLNYNQHAPLRVLYGAEMLKKLTQAVRASELEASDRCGLLLDALALTKAGKMDPACLIGLVGAYENEENAVVWEALRAVINELSFVITEIDDSSINEKFDNFVFTLIQKPFTKLGWTSKESDSDLVKKQRALFVNLSCSHGRKQEAVNSEAMKRFNAFLEDHNTKLLPDDYKFSVFSLALSSSHEIWGEKETFPQRNFNCYEKLLKIAQLTTTKAACSLAIFSAVGTIEFPEYRIKVLEFCLSNGIRAQDFHCPLISMSGSKGGRDLLSQWGLDNWAKLEARCSAQFLIQQHVVRAICTSCNRESADKLEKFFKNQKNPMIIRVLNQSLEAARAKARFVDAIAASPLAKSNFWNTSKSAL